VNEPEVDAGRPRPGGGVKGLEDPINSLKGGGELLVANEGKRCSASGLSEHVS